jgi:aminopeptidase
MGMSYEPSQEILEKYAKVLVNFALNSGKGIKPGDVVRLSSPLSALPFYRALKRQIIDSGGLIIGSLADDMEDGAAKYYFEKATNTQLTTFLDKYYKGLTDQIDHSIAVLADHDPHELDGVDPKKIMLASKTNKPVSEWLEYKENQGKYTWTLALYGTPAMAKEAGLSLKEYWDQIIKACYLDEKDPVAANRKVMNEVDRVAKALTKLDIEKLHMVGKEGDVDLRVVMGKGRRWLGGTGRNIPSFEVFTSPDWRGTEGRIKFNMPLYRYGSMVEGIELTFKEGRVVKATAKKNEKLLKEMLATDEGASQMGEFSLTDRRLSRITKFMAETLYDENMGGEFGNTHLAVGRSYHDTYAPGPEKMTPALAKRLGYNNSTIHTDMFSTTNRTVTAILKNGKTKVIYENGQFTI